VFISNQKGTRLVVGSQSEVRESSGSSCDKNLGTHVDQLEREKVSTWESVEARAPKGCLTNRYSE
jgi:hypothetical protein